MKKFLKIEFGQFRKELKSLDNNSSIILVSSAILFVISWYFVNPKFFKESDFLPDSQLIITEQLLSFIYWFVADFILLFIIPAVIIKLNFRVPLKQYGCGFGELKIGFIFTALSIFFFSPVIYFISISDEFGGYFPLLQSAKNDIATFVAYEFFFVLFIFSWEFIFRGYLLFGLKKKFGFHAVLIQMIPFVLLHTGKPFSETFASIFGALFLGYLAYRTDSFYYGFLIHAAILVALDILSFMS